jgi:hypothetical protein
VFIRLHRSFRKIGRHTGSSYLSLLVYVENPSCWGLGHAVEVSPSTAGFMTLSLLEDYDAVQRAIELDNAALLKVVFLPSVLKAMAVLAVIVVGILIDTYWRTRNGMESEVIKF